MSDWYLESLNDEDVITTIPLYEEKEYRIGRKKNFEISTANLLVSREHGVITKDETGIYIRDTKSCNGIWVNDMKIPVNINHPLGVDDIIGIGAPSNVEEKSVELFVVRRQNVDKANVISRSENNVSAESSAVIINNNPLGNHVENNAIENERTQFSFSNEDLMEVDENDDFFPPSQLFDIKPQLPEDKSENFCNYDVDEIRNSFDLIKKENILPDPLEIEISDDDDCDIWFTKLLQSACEKNIVPTDVKPNLQCTSSVELSDNNENIASVSDSKDDILSTKLNAPNVSFSNIEIDNSINSGRVIADISYTKCDRETKTAKISLPIETSNRSNYTKPPIIEPPHMNRKRKSSTYSKSKENNVKRTKVENETSKASTSETSFSKVNKRINIQIKQLTSKKYSPTVHISKPERQSINEERKKKLKEITSRDDALRRVNSKENDKKITKTLTKPKVKISDSRGLFLTASEKAPEAEKSKYTIPKIKQKVQKENLALASDSTADRSILGKIKKHVRFKDTPDVKEFVIETGNSLKKLIAKDAPIPKHNSMPHIKLKAPAVEDGILSSVLTWVPMWLEEQKQFHNAPPVSTRRPSPMLQTFNSLEDYCDTVTPLLLLELWKSVHRDWQINQNLVILASVDKIEAMRKPSGILLCLKCHFLCTKQDNGQPNVGDLVIAEVALGDGKKVSKKFGYIKDITKRRLFPEDLINEKLVQSLNKRPEYVAHFILLTREFTNNINTDKPIRIRSVSRIAPSLRLFNSVYCLGSSPLCKLILKPKVEDYKVPESSELPDFKMDFTKVLDENQLKCVKEAVQICTGDEPKIYMIQGPPGTGKSRVITKIIEQLHYGFRNQRNSDRRCLLVCAPSNGAIDDLTLKLLDLRSTYERNLRFNMIRVGPLNSIHPKVREICVPSLVQRHIKNMLQKDIEGNTGLSEDYSFRRSKIHMLQNKLMSLRERNAPPELIKETEMQLAKSQESFEIFTRRSLQEMTYRAKFENEREIEKQLVEKADIICTTLSSCMNARIEELYLRGRLSFRCCIVDEATQCNEQDALIPLMLGIKKLILVGDTEQLPATVLSREAQGLGYGNSLFSRIQACIEHFPDNPIKMLNVQYRMHSEICKFPNEQFYCGKLRTGLPARTHNDILHPYRVFCLNSPISLSASEYLNVPEGKFVTKLTELILNHSDYNIGIITPYSKQKNLVESKFNELPRNNRLRITVNTVDGFQGQERDVIIMSCVRYDSNSFLSDRQRLNVSLTRAKHAVFVCAHAQLFTTNNIWKKLKSDALDRGNFFTVSEENCNSLDYISSLIYKNKK